MSTIYRAKRAGWDEELTAEKGLDLTPVSESYDSMDLEGELVEVPYQGGKIYLVGGAEADPNTLEEVK